MARKTTTLETFDEITKQITSELRLLEKGFNPARYFGPGDQEFTREEIIQLRGKVATNEDVEITEHELTILWAANSDFRFSDHQRVSDVHLRATAALAAAGDGLASNESEAEDEAEAEAETETDGIDDYSDTGSSDDDDDNDDDTEVDRGEEIVMDGGYVISRTEIPLTAHNVNLMIEIAGYVNTNYNPDSSQFRVVNSLMQSISQRYSDGGNDYAPTDEELAVLSGTCNQIRNNTLSGAKEHNYGEFLALLQEIDITREKCRVTQRTDGSKMKQLYT